MHNLNVKQLAIKHHILSLILLVFTSTTFAQQSLEFVENKGQWDNAIQYKGQLTTGSFALKKDGGYKMTLLNHDDLRAVGDRLHGHKNHQSSSGASGGDSEQTVSSTNSNNTSVPSNNNGIIRGHVYEVSFLNANPNPLAVADKPQSFYNNYYIGNDKTKWASGCKVFGAVTYKNVYPNIDVRYYSDKGQLKYDIIVNPGGNINRVALYVDGVESLKLKDEQLIFKTTVDEVKEAIPYSYQSGKKGKQTVACRFEVKGNIVRYKLDNLVDNDATLVVDPSLIFSTFTGSTANNWGFTASYDGAGNFYAGGIVFGDSYPFQNGAFGYQGGNIATGEEEGGFDIGIIKFNPTGTAKVYATYLGGKQGNDYPQSLIVDANNNLVIAGKSTASDYPGSTRASNRTDYDIVISKFRADGTALIGSRMFGGTGSEGVNIQNKYASPALTPASVSTRRNYGDDSRSEVIIDGFGNILLASCTQSTDFPTVNAFQNTNGGANASGRAQDGVFIKASSDLSTILVSSYLGGNNDDAAFVLSINPSNGNIYVAGGTASTNFPGDKTGVLNTTNSGGDCDGFVAILNSTGTQLLKNTYLGTSGADVVYGIQFDKYGYPYVMGTTTGSWVVTSNVAFVQNGGKQFISKLQPNLSAYVYSTVFGTNTAAPNISPTAFLVDRCENVYVSGWGGFANTNFKYAGAGTNGLPITADAIKKTGDGSDFYFFVMERNATKQLYGSFFGQNGGYGEHVDGGTSRFDANGIIYQSLCSCYDDNPGVGNAFPTSGGAFASTKPSATFCNLAAIKIAFNLSGVGAGVQSSIQGMANRKTGCVFTEVEFKDTLALGKTYVWNFGDGSPEQTTTIPNIKHAYTVVGNYSVRLISIDSSTCNISDTSYVTIRVRNDAATLALNATKLAPCNALSYQFDNTSIAPVGKPFSNNSFTLFFGDGTQQIVGVGSFQHSYPAAGTYNAGLILRDTNYCNYPDTIRLQLRIAANVKAQFSTPAIGCAPYQAVITNTSLAGETFTWDFGDGTTYVGVNPPPHLYNGVGSYTIKLSVVDANTCNKIDSTSFTITVSGKPISAFTFSPNPPQANTAVVFTNNSIGVASSYKWLYGDGDSLVTNNISALVSHIYNATNTYNACLIAANLSGCKDTSCQNVRAITVPLLDVPSALTPNGDGINDNVFVKGYGITKMDWRIYNRWGVLMFRSSSQKIGWDGKFKGNVQAQDVYTYTLEVEFSNGTKYSKTGDITLLR
ncbi:MAG: PKD domain-containing protein [Flavobacterium sp.]|nr:PKD domain-containing protein [Flavobacterium sp.]